MLLSLANYRLDNNNEALIAIQKAYMLTHNKSYLYYEDRIKKKSPIKIKLTDSWLSKDESEVLIQPENY